VSTAAFQADAPAGSAPTPAELRVLFHRLNNQLGIILAHAELLEIKSPDDVCRARASQIVATALEAMGTSRALAQRTDPASHSSSIS
jgi:hypothetical protein